MSLDCFVVPSQELINPLFSNWLVGVTEACGLDAVGFPRDLMMGRRETVFRCLEN